MGMAENEPWIAKDLFSRLERLAGGENPRKFVEALQRGIVGPTGESGIKVLRHPAGRYTHELKIVGTAQRLLGYVDEHGQIIFDRFERGGLH